MVLTELVADSPIREKIITAVRYFNDWTAGNDPHKEHDAGFFGVDGVRYMWKIDYYDVNYEYGADPYTDKFCRVLTVMEASEY